MNKIYIILLLFLVNTYKVRSQHIAAGEEYSLFLCSNDSKPVMSFGTNFYGQLGNSTQYQISIPSYTSLYNKNIIKVSARIKTSFFLENDGTVWACGNGSYGQIGDGSVGYINLLPKIINTVSGITDIATGDHTLFLKKDGTVWACGRNHQGQLGKSGSQYEINPFQINNLNDVIGIATGSSHSLFLKKDGTVWACGNSTFGQLGFSTSPSTGANMPTKINDLNNVKAIACGPNFSLFLLDDGTVYSCGDNSKGQLGDGTTISHTIPTKVNGLTGITSISAGSRFSYFLKNDGTVWACGSIGLSIETSPIQIDKLNNIKEINCGTAHSLFLKNDGTFWICKENSSSPSQISGLCNAFLNVEENIKKPDLILYPNPNNGTFFINKMKDGISVINKIQIYNLLGQKVYSSEINSENNEINFTKESKGIYVYQLLNENNIVKTGKIIVE